MKQILLLILFCTGIISCKAQTIIVPLGSEQDYEFTSDYYKKDVNNELEKFTGTWKYTNGSTEVIFKLKKEEQYQTTNNYYIDLLVGEYRYIENDIEEVNTLADFDSSTISGFQHNLSGGVFTYNLPTYCDDNSTSSEIKITLSIEDPNDQYTSGKVILRHINDDGIEKLETCIYDYTNDGDDPNARISIPDGNYVFVKQS
ncbi:MAG: hypothetical protein CMC76_05945 [Flavobacteriaceae bacterium]|nr:hypothetical protein [Flavobacteriaceae bacterium]